MTPTQVRNVFLRWRRGSEKPKQNAVRKGGKHRSAADFELARILQVLT